METLTTSSPQTTDSEDMPSSVDDAAVVDDSPDDSQTPQPTTQAQPRGRLRKITKRFGRGAAIRGAAEVIGVGVDAALMGAGAAGVDVMKSVAIREITATAPEVAVIDRLMHRHGHERSEEAARRVLKKMGSVAVGVSVAVVAQKAGLDVLEHVHSNHGMLHFAVPLGSKVGAMSGLSAVRRNLRF